MVIMLAAQGASAISLRFKFKTNSSGPNIYACNAGIMTPTHSRICYVEGSKTQCTPQNCDANGENCENSCVCTSAGGGDMLMNYAYTESRAWSDNPTDVGGPATPARVTSAGAQNDFNKFFADQASWDKILTTLLLPGVIFSLFNRALCFIVPIVQDSPMGHSFIISS